MWSTSLNLYIAASIFNFSFLILLYFFSLAVLSDMRVKEYLIANPRVLEDFIMADISQEQLERWLIRKTQSVEHINGGVGNGMSCRITLDSVEI